MRYVLWVQAASVSAAAWWQQQLCALQVETELHVVEKINARHLRQQPALALLLDEQGLSLSANGMRMQPDWVGQLHRLKRATHKSELLARACRSSEQPRLLDCTAGLGHDALLLASLGAQVVLLERHPILYALLKSSYEQALLHPELQAVMSRITVLHADAADYLTTVALGEFDVIYLDPMFPKPDQPDKKRAQVKKEMQILHVLLAQQGTMDLGENLLTLAQDKAARVIVKRPRLAPTLTADTPQHQWLGDACRFDGYFQPSR